MTRIKVGEKRTYIIPLRREFLKVPRWRKSKRAIDALQAYILRHTKVENIKLSNLVNQEVWKHGGKNPPSKVKVEVTIENKKVQDKKTKKDVDIPFAMVELTKISKRDMRIIKKTEEKAKKFKTQGKSETKADVMGKDPKKLAEELKKKLTGKKKEKPEDEKASKSTKELAKDLHKAEEKKKAKVTKAQEANMHK